MARWPAAVLISLCAILLLMHPSWLINRCCCGALSTGDTPCHPMAVLAKLLLALFGVAALYFAVGGVLAGRTSGKHAWVMPHASENHIYTHLPLPKHRPRCSHVIYVAIALSQQRSLCTHICLCAGQWMEVWSLVLDGLALSTGQGGSRVSEATNILCALCTVCAVVDLPAKQR